LEEEELKRGWDRLGLVGIGYRELYDVSEVNVLMCNEFKSSLLAGSAWLVNSV